MATPGHDPVHWSVLDVQDFIREKANDNTIDFSNSHLPLLESFLQQLRDHDIDGEVLLTAVDTAFLREECGIASFGLRAKIMRCINALKGASLKLSTSEGPTLSNTPIWGVTTSQADSASAAPIATPAAETGQKVRAGEDLIQDEHGRKRRKLDLSQKSVQIPVRRNDSSPDASGYLPAHKFTVDRLFFGDTKLGGEIGELSPPQEYMAHAPSYAGITDSGILQGTAEEFQLKPYPANLNPGVKQYVYKQMQHFLNAAPLQEFQNNGRKGAFVLPYRETYLGGNLARSALVLQMKEDGSIAAYRRNAAFIHEDYEYEASNEDVENGHWDYLLHKYRVPTDKTISLDGDLSEGETVSSSLILEIEEEEEELAKLARGQVSRERACEIVDEAVQHTRDTWSQMALPKLERTTRTVWRMMRQSKTIRTGLIAQANSTIESLNKRLDKYKAEVLHETYASEDAIREICRVFDATIEDLEEQKWRISVWRTQREPPPSGRAWRSNRSGSGRAQQAGHGNRGHTFRPASDDRLSLEPYSPEQLASGDIIAEHHSEKVRAPVGDPAATDDVAMDNTNECLDAISISSDDSEMADFVVADDGSATPTPLGDRIAAALNSIETEDNVKSEFQNTPQRSRTGLSKTEPIELVSSSEDNFRDKAIKRELAWREEGSYVPPKTPKKAGLKIPSTPSGASASEIDTWDYESLVGQQNYRCLLAKMLRDAGPDFIDKARKYYMTLYARMKTHVLEAIQTIRSGENQTSTNQRDIFMLDLTKLLCAWWLKRPFAGPGICADDIDWSYKDMIDNELANYFWRDFPQIIHRLHTANTLKTRSMQVAQRSTNLTSSDAERTDDQSDGSSGEHLSSPLQKRGQKQIQESQHGKDMRHSAQKRMQDYKKALTHNQSLHLARLDGRDNVRGVESKIAINPAKGDDQDFIHILSHIASSIKQHQIEGIRFLWREITTGGQDDPQGCLLAHTMGLGKTMQSIALLVALNQTARSKDKRIYMQLPPTLRPEEMRKGRRKMRFLIMSPPSLLENWRNEIAHWAGDILGVVFTVSKAKASISIMGHWYESGGVLLVGYPMVREIIAGKIAEWSEADREAAEELLLDSPELIIADEAHTLRNEKSIVSTIAKRFRTRSRIALTGTPMNNDVQEIYSLVSWVSPGFLGDKSEFNSLYAQPIESGTYKDSTTSQKRTSIKKLAVLREQIEPKVNRADITVLRGSLKPKVEFVITVPLSTQQVSAYKKFRAALMSDVRNEKVSNTKMFAWLATLTLLTNHPLAFKRKLIEPLPNKPAPKASRALREASMVPDRETDAVSTPNEGDGEEGVEEKAPDDDHVFQYGLTEHTVKQIVSELDDDMDPNLSAKTAIFASILTHAERCGDKVLVFSSSIPTLQYVEDLLDRIEMPYGRIDGSVPTTKRLEIIEKFRKATWGVLLVSTKAGGLGLNIQSANRVVILDFGFNPSWEEQAVGRTYRLGQTKPVFVYRFVAGGTFETNMYHKQLFKSSLSRRVVDKKNPTRNAERTKEWLYDPLDVAQEDISEWKGKDPLVLDKLIESHEKGETTYMRAIKTMETLQQEDASDEPLTAEERAEVKRELEEGRMRFQNFRSEGVAGEEKPDEKDTDSRKLTRPARRGGGLQQPPAHSIQPSSAPGESGPGHSEGPRERRQVP